MLLRERKDGLVGHIGARREDDAGHSGNDGTEDRPYPGVMDDAAKHRGDKDHHDIGGQHRAEGAKRRSQHAPLREAHVGRHIDHNGAGGGFADREEVGELLLAEPPVRQHRLANKGNGTVGTAEGEGADLQEVQKKRKIDAHFVFSSSVSSVPVFSFFSRKEAPRPMRAAARIR